MPGTWKNRLAWVLGWVIAERYREEVLDDLLEEHERRGDAPWAGAPRLGFEIVRAGVASRVHGWKVRRERRPGSVSGSPLRDLGHDLRHAARAFRREPLFTGVAVLTLTLGLGGALAIGAVLNGVFLRPLPYPEADRLVLVRGSDAGRHAVSYPLIAAARRSSRTLEGVAAWQGWSAVMREADGTLGRRNAASVSADYLDLLGVAPLRGRWFSPAEGELGHAPVVVLGHDTWVREFGGDPAAVGRSVELDGEAHRVVGVAPAGLRDPVAAGLGLGPQPALWRARPPSFDETTAGWGWIGFWGVGRTAPGVGPRDVTAELAALTREGNPDFPADATPELETVTVREAAVREVRPTLLVLAGAVVVVLLIGCANVANLLLGRATVRGREVAVRASLGATRGRLVRQFLAEGLLLSGVATVSGLAAGLAGARVLSRMAGADLPDTTQVVLDVRLVGGAVLLALLTTLLFAVMPAFRFAAGGFMAGLRERGASRSSTGVRRLLVLAETALAVVLLVAAGLFARTLLNLMAVDPGFDAGRLATLVVGLPEERFTSEEDRTTAFARVVEAAGSASGVRAAGAVTDFPMSGAVNSTPVAPAGQAGEEATHRLQTLVRAVSPGWFEAMGIPVLEGRAVEEGDGAGTEPVAVVNRAFARRFFEGGDPLGRVVRVRDVDRRIVGVVANVTEFTLSGGPDPVLYEPYAQNRESWMRSAVWLVVRADEAPAAAAAEVRRRLRELDPRLTLGPVRPVRAWVEADVAASRFRVLLVGLFGAVSLLLAVVGIAGVMAYRVARRLPELGLRIALGASRRDVSRLVLREAARLAGAGALLGLALATAGTRLLSAFLFGVPPTDPVVFGAVALLLPAVALLACWIPARRAARVDPVRSLRAE